MRILLLWTLPFVAVFGAEEAELPKDRAADWTCFLTITGHAIEPLDRPEHSRRSFGAYVSAGTGCQAGVVYLGVYPETTCTVRRSNEDMPMVFEYEPRVIQVAVTPGNTAVGMLQISTNDAGECRFNTYIASCGTAVPEGGRCEKLEQHNQRHNEVSGSTRFAFNSARR